METKRITIAEVLRITVSTLQNINIPAALIEQIGMPIAGSIRNLQECLNAIENAQKAEAVTEEVSGDPLASKNN